MSQLTLYHNGPSTCSQKVRLILELKGLEYESKLIDLMSYNDFLNNQYHSFLIVSDSGTAQEEAAMFKNTVITPRNYTC